MSISCQLTTGPIAYAFFGTFPKYFILTNLLAAPLAGIIIPYSLAVAGLSAIGICPDLLITGLEFMIQTLIGILEIISSI
jgi:predicted membrane metal-binding protein